MEEKKNLMTYEGLKEFEDELQELKVNRRKGVAQKIKEAREQGDLSENAEYKAAKDEQERIEARIGEIEQILKDAEVIDIDENDHENVNFGSKVLVHDIDMDEMVTYKIVGSKEADVLKGKISNESPFGKAFIGKKIGDTVTVEAPGGNYKYKILDVTNKAEREK